MRRNELATLGTIFSLTARWPTYVHFWGHNVFPNKFVWADENIRLVPHMKYIGDQLIYGVLIERMKHAGL